MTKCYMFNKPQGCITARKDDRHKTVMDYFPEEMREEFHPAGRLDKNTEGFLVITNDGKLTMKLCDPQYQTVKEYFMWAIGEMDEDKIRLIREGIYIKNREEPCLEADITIHTRDNLYNIKDMLSVENVDKLMKNKNLPVFSATISVKEGKKHQVKRMMKAVGATVVYLKRIKIGNVVLDEKIFPGNFREMTSQEIKGLQESVNDKRV